VFVASRPLVVAVPEIPAAVPEYRQANRQDVRDARYVGSMDVMTVTNKARD